MNRRRRKLLRRLLRAIPTESVVDRHEHARLIAEQVLAAKFPGAAHKRMILLSIIVAALGVISLVCLLIVVWPAPPTRPRPWADELRARRRLYPPGDTVDRVEP